MFRTKVKNRIINLFILLPLFWAFSGLFYSSNGKKQVGIFMLISILLILYKYGKSTLANNIRENKVLILLFLSLLYSLFLFVTYDFGSSRFRALSFSFLFLIFLPKEILTKKYFYYLLLFGALFVISYATWFTVILERGRDWNFNVIPFSTFTAVICIFSVFLLFYENRNKYKIILILSFGLSIASLLMGQSRGVWLAFIVTSLLCFLLLVINNKTNKKLLLVLPMLTVIVTLFTCQKIEQRILQTTNEFSQIEKKDFSSSIGLRMKMWTAAIELSFLSPILGLQDDHIIEFNKLYKNNDNPNMVAMKYYAPPHYHMEILNTLVKSGAVGVFLLLLPFIYIFVYFWRQRNIGASLLLLLSSIYLISGLSDIPLSHGSHIVFFWLMLYYLTNNPEFSEKIYPKNHSSDPN